MSHSLIAKRTRTRSVKLSGSVDLNMALASDSLFDKFGLWQTLETNEAIVEETVEGSSGTEIDPLPNFEDLDFGDLLEIKDEPLAIQESLIQEDDDPFSFNMESLVDEASLDSIKSDCMWSSVNLFNNLDMNSRKRRRDVSLTLSECAEGLLSINQLDVNMLDQISDAPLGASPPFMSSTFGSFENEDSVSSDDNDDEEDEIDVVGTDLVGSSARTRHCNLKERNNAKKQHHMKIEAGRSLLKKQQPKQVVHDQHKTILDDHCYFLATKPETLLAAKEMAPAVNGLKGMLTPNESSEDEDDIFKTGTTTMTSVVDKRKIAEAVQSLIKNRPLPENSSNIKFKFRMKFKSTQAASSIKKLAVNKAMLIEEVSQQSRRERRKSASKNAYCPPPMTSPKSSSPSKVNNTKKQQQQINTQTILSNRKSTDSDKCREIRDLHNSMERQRRVEQRNHLAYLKKQVPEVADMEKASKLTILRKAMDYCHLLSNLDQRIRKDKEKELAKNQMLKKKLMELTQKHDARRITTSGRLTGWSHGRY